MATWRRREAEWTPAKRAKRESLLTPVPPIRKNGMAHTTFFLSLKRYAAEGVRRSSGRNGGSVWSLDQRSSIQPRLFHVRVSGALEGYSFEFRVSSFKRASLPEIWPSFQGARPGDFSDVGQFVDLNLSCFELGLEAFGHGINRLGDAFFDDFPQGDAG